jgi:hypothetical protein
VRPATLLHVEDPWSAWCVDQAALMVGLAQQAPPDGDAAPVQSEGFVFGATEGTVHIPWVGSVDLPDDG